MYINDAYLSTMSVAESQGDYQRETGIYQWVEVLVDCPGNSDLFTYRLPPQLEIKPGDILTVPFGAQKLGAIAIRLVRELPADLPAQKVKEVEDVVTRAFFPPAYWELLCRVATYYYTPLIQVIRVALPPGLLGRSQRRLRLTQLGKEIDLNNNQHALVFLSPTAISILELLRTQATGDYSFQYIQQKIKFAYRGTQELCRRELVESYLEPPRLTQPKWEKVVILLDHNHRDLTSRQAEIVEVLRRRGGELSQRELLQICHASPGILKTLTAKQHVVIEEREVLRIESGLLIEPEQDQTLTSAQTECVDLIKSQLGYAQILLHGVTGSGKTEVYLQAIAPLIKQGKSVLVLVPEIGLTPQLTDRFRARFGTRVKVYHSALADGERYDTWRQMLTGSSQIIIGTRSAVFAPLPKLGLIILDEEHDSSFKQDTPIPTYHARDVAQWRAEIENCPLILGSATPALETWVNIQQNRDPQKQTFYLNLPERINSRPFPPIEIVDMRQELQCGNRSIFSRKLKSALQQIQETAQQGILFIHRRGHSTFVSCRHCGYVLECPNCDVSLAYHHPDAGAPELLRCHYCNYGRAHPQQCPECSSPYLKFFGSGTQRVAEELTREFPQLRLIRFDSDTTRNKGSHRTLLTQFINKEADLLVGTQMLTKGLDLPQVTLVGVVAADGLLHLSDYRASERAFQTLTQVAGRAGRGDDPGKVIMQTYTPTHPVIVAVQNNACESFYQTELEQRLALNYPPYGRLILLRLSSFDSIQVQNTAERIATALNGLAEWEILGPAPANILRVANRYRWQILLKFKRETAISLSNWGEIRHLCPASVSLTIDVDPINIM